MGWYSQKNYLQTSYDQYLGREAYQLWLVFAKNYSQTDDQYFNIEPYQEVF